MSLKDFEHVYLNMYAPNKLLSFIALQCFGMEIDNVSIKKSSTQQLICYPEPYCRKIHLDP